MAKNLRICHVVGDSAFGGGSQIILSLVRASLNAGFSVSVIATDPVFCRHLCEAGADIVELDCIWRSVRPLRDLRGLVHLKKHFDTTGYNLVHTHTSKAGFVGRVAARLARVPVVVHTVHGFSFHEATPWPLRTLHVAMEKVASYCCDMVVTVSAFHRDWAINLRITSSDKIIAIPNGVHEAECVDDETRAGVRSELGVQAGQILVLSASRLARGKGLEHLVEVGRRMHVRGRSDIRIIIAGTGEIEAELQEMVGRYSCGEVVELIGFRRDVGQLLGAADIVVLPSEREGLSVALLETLAAGRAVIVSSIGSNLEAAEDVAVFIAYGDIDGLEAALVDLVDFPERRAELGHKARARYEERYTERGMIHDYMALYRTLLSAERHPPRRLL